LDYLEYAYLQGGQDREAKRVLDELIAIQKVQPEAFQAAYAFAAIPARYAIETRRWSDAASLTLYPATFPWNRFAWAEAVVYFARALGSARSGNVTDARNDIEKLRVLHEALVKAKDKYWAEQVDVQGRAAGAWLAHAEGRNEEALKLMRSAADLEDSTDKHPVTPAPIMPARELLGDLLLELNEPKQALGEFEKSLSREPNRFHALYSVAKAAELSGDPQRAKSYYEKVVVVCSQADTERSELQQAKAFLAKK
jgi:tetratricopeptide (TPR) repeat protein